MFLSSFSSVQDFHLCLSHNTIVILQSIRTYFYLFMSTWKDKAYGLAVNFKWIWIGGSNTNHFHLVMSLHHLLIMSSPTTIFIFYLDGISSTYCIYQIWWFCHPIFCFDMLFYWSIFEECLQS